jgi:FAD/FMN-containing dehydrogenase
MSFNVLPGEQQMKRISRVAWVVTVVLCVVAVVILFRPFLHIAKTAVNDVDERVVSGSTDIDDASRLNGTRVEEIVLVDPGVAPEQQISELLDRARESGRRVSIAGARHSMGGHVIYPDGIVIDMSAMKAMRVDTEAMVLDVQAGALWDDVITHLDPMGLSVAIMQSNDSFSVGGSLSVNCHGWQFGKPPIASSVRSFRLMLADGRVVRCSREENSELFSLAIGGYGLFGVILDVRLDLVPNELYRIEQRVVRTDEALDVFDREVSGREGLSMVYARMNVAPDAMLDELILNVFFVEEDADVPTLPSDEEAGAAQSILRGLKRVVFRGSGGSDYGKSIRWEAETSIAPQLIGRTFTRNQLLGEGVETLENRSAETTDILHEYFLPRENLLPFIRSVRDIVEDHDGDLMNVTVRQVAVDEDSFLRYADVPMVSLVMLFLQDRDEAGELGMQAMTSDLIDASLQNEGRYYLPYRLHASIEQFRTAYPDSERFFELKRKHDPDELFQNRFYLKYGGS